MNHLSIKNLTVAFDQKMVLDNFNADFSTGLHWVRGHNGSGKSTLLKATCGMIETPADQIYIMGHDLVREPMAAKAQICMVPDKPEVYPFMSGRQYLAFMTKIKRQPSHNQALMTWLEKIKLTPFLDIPFAEMSFGTRRKFALSGVLIGNPQVILLDEPFNGLDQETAAAFHQWLIIAKENKCILIVNHEAHFVANIADSTLDITEQKS